MARPRPLRIKQAHFRLVVGNAGPAGIAKRWWKVREREGQGREGQGREGRQGVNSAISRGERESDEYGRDDAGMRRTSQRMTRYAKEVDVYRKVRIKDYVMLWMLGKQTLSCVTLRDVLIPNTQFTLTQKHKY